MTITEKFLTLFKEMEKKLIDLSGLHEDEHVSFSYALNTCYHQKKHPLLSSFENVDFLRTCADVRNILSHENDALIPTESLVEGLEGLLEKLDDQKTIYDICTREIETTSYEESLLSVKRRMDTLGFSHLPILQDGKVIGVFSRQSLFDSFSSSKAAYEKVGDLKPVLGVGDHTNEAYLFCKTSSKISDLFDYLTKRKSHAKEIKMVFVTDTGKRDGRLSGVATIADILRYYALGKTTD